MNGSKNNKNRPPRSRNYSFTFKRPIFICEVRETKSSKNPTEAQTINPKQVKVEASQSYIKPRTRKSVHLISPEGCDLRSKILSSELKIEDIENQKKILNEKSAFIKETNLKYLSQSLSKLSQEKSNLKKISFIEPYSHAKSKEFFRAIKENNFSQVKALLVEFPELKNIVDSAQQNALHWAAKRGSSDMIDFLLRHKVNWKHFDLAHKQPLAIATKSNNRDAIFAFNRFIYSSYSFGKDPSIKHMLSFKLRFAKK